MSKLLFYDYWHHKHYIQTNSVTDRCYCELGIIPCKLQVADNVWMAHGYGLANSVAIKGDDGIIIVDTMDSDTPAQEVAPLFIEATSK